MPHPPPTILPSALCRVAATLALALLGTSGALAASFEVAWRDTLTVASGDAHVGPWRMNQSDFRYVDDPSVALGNDGQAAVVWVDQASQAVLFQRYDDQGNARLEGPSDVSRSAGTFSWLPRVIMAANEPDTLYVLWQEILFTGGSHGGDSFSPAVIVPHSGDGEPGVNGSLQGLLMRKLAVNRDGELAVVNSTFQPSERSRVRLLRGRLAL